MSRRSPHSSQKNTSMSGAPTGAAVRMIFPNASPTGWRIFSIVRAAGGPDAAQDHARGHALGQRRRAREHERAATREADRGEPVDPEVVEHGNDVGDEVDDLVVVVLRRVAGARPLDADHSEAASCGLLREVGRHLAPTTGRAVEPQDGITGRVAEARPAHLPAVLEAGRADGVRWRGHDRVGQPQHRFPPWRVTDAGRPHGPRSRPCATSSSLSGSTWVTPTILAGKVTV